MIPPGWLTPLVAALDADPRLGAVVPKTRFEGRFHELVIEAAATWRPGPRRRARAGVAAEGASRSTASTSPTAASSSTASGSPVGAVAGPAPAPCSASRRSPGATVGPAASWPPRRAAPSSCTVNGEPAVRAEPGDGVGRRPARRGEPVVVIANVGNERRADGYGLDRRPLRGGPRASTTRPVDVPAWCGGAVLLRGSYLRDVGPFDERLFLYYEDLELSLRGSARGWRYRYEPASVVEHRVGSSSSGGGASPGRAAARSATASWCWPATASRRPRWWPSWSGSWPSPSPTCAGRSWPRRCGGRAPCGWLLKVRGLALPRGAAPPARPAGPAAGGIAGGPGNPAPCLIVDPVR